MSNTPVDRFAELTSLVDDLEKLVEERYEEDRSSIDIQNKKLGSVVKNQIEIQLEWGDIQKMTNFLVSEIEDELDFQTAVAIQELMDTNNRKLTVTEAKLYAASVSEVVDTKKLRNRMVEISDQVKSITGAIDTRKYIIKNLTDILTNGREDYII